MVAATQLGQAGPNLEAIANARGAAYKVFLVIDRVSVFQVVKRTNCLDRLYMFGE